MRDSGVRPAEVVVLHPGLQFSHPHLPIRHRRPRSKTSTQRSRRRSLGTSARSVAVSHWPRPCRARSCDMNSPRPSAYAPMTVTRWWRWVPRSANSCIPSPSRCACSSTTASSTPAPAATGACRSRRCRHASSRAGCSPRPPRPGSLPASTSSACRCTARLHYCAASAAIWPQHAGLRRRAHRPGGAARDQPAA